MKAKPKLADLMNQYMGKDQNLDPSLTEEEIVQYRKDKREQLKKKLIALYDDQSQDKNLNEAEIIQKSIKTIKRKSDV